MPLFATGWNPISWSGTFGKLVIGKAQAVEHAKASSLETQLMGAWSDGLAFKPLMKLSEEQRQFYCFISNDWGADTQKHCYSFNSSFFTKFNNLASTAIAKWRETLLDCTHFMDFLSFQQGALTPKPPPASRWVWCYEFPLAIRSSVSGHDGVRNKGCCTHNDLRCRWRKTYEKKNAERFLAKAPAKISSTMRSHGDEESCLHLK